MAKRYLILGGGIAALSAAKAIREQDAGGLIVVLSNEGVLPYYRPSLTKQLLGNVAAEDLAVKKAAWYDAPGRDIIVLGGRTVTAIDVKAKHVTLADGLVFPYDRLVYALGARCFIPPFKGADRENVIAIRSFTDAEKVRRLAKTARTAVVIGGGVLGLEAAWSLRQGGIAVTVVEFEKQIMSRQIDAEAAAHLEQTMQQADVTLLTGVSTAAVDDEGLHLTDGRCLPADIVIVSAGIRGNVEIAAEAVIKPDRKIIVNSRMETSEPDVYAAGDCAAFGMSYGLWAEASEMGKIAGINAAGGSAEYRPVLRPLMFHGFGTELYAIGDTGRDPSRTYEVGSMPGARYYSVDDRIVGAILTGDTSRAEEVRRLVQGDA